MVGILAFQWLVVFGDIFDRQKAFSFGNEQRRAILLPVRIQECKAKASAVRCSVLCVLWARLSGFCSRRCQSQHDFSVMLHALA